jgi:hypothetical protein
MQPREEPAGVANGQTVMSSPPKRGIVRRAIRARYRVPIFTLGAGNLR